MKVNETPISFQLDTGGDITLIGRTEWMMMGNPKLQPAEIDVRCANGSRMSLLGKTDVEFQLKGGTFKGCCYVREEGNLIGLDWLQKSDDMRKLMHKMVNSVETRVPASIRDELNRMFPNVFADGLGKCVKEKASLHVKEGAKPSFRKARPVPYGSLEVVNQELDRLLDIGVITPKTHSDWAAPIVVVKKKNGKPRVCADFKSRRLNSIETQSKALDSEIYPLPLPEDIFANLNGGAVFTQLDLSDAYFQIQLDRDSQKLCCINTHRGLFQYKRLPFGVKPATML